MEKCYIIWKILLKIFPQKFSFFKKISIIHKFFGSGKEIYSQKNMWRKHFFREKYQDHFFTKIRKTSRVKCLLLKFANKRWLKSYDQRPLRVLKMH